MEDYNCITLSGWLLDVAAFVVTFGWVFFDDLSMVKDSFDDEGKRFSFIKSYFMKRWDNLGKKFFAGLAGAILSGEVGYPIVMHYLEDSMASLPEFADDTLNISLVVICTFFAVKKFGNKK